MENPEKRKLHSVGNAETSEQPQKEGVEQKSKMDRREFFRTVFLERNKKEEQDIAALRAKLKPDSAPAEAPAETQEQSKVDKKTGGKKKKSGLSRRAFLSLAAAGAAGTLLAVNKWDYVTRFRHQLEREKIPDGLAGVIEKIKDEYVYVEQSADPERWATEIEKAFTTSDLERTEENLGAVLALITAESGFRIVPRVYDYSPALDEQDFRIVKSDIGTGGPMELGYDHVMQSEGVTYEEAVEIMNDLEKSLYHSFNHLASINKVYKDVGDTELRLKAIFADWNAGTYSSVNAGLQETLQRLTGKTLGHDGILGNKTKQVIKELLSAHGLDASKVDVDISGDRGVDYRSTETWKAIESINKQPILPAVAKTPVLGWYGWLKKITTGVGDSEEFADARFEEFTTINSKMAELQVK